MREIIQTKIEDRTRILEWRAEKPPRSFQWIAKQLGVTRTRAYQQYRKAIASTGNGDAIRVDGVQPDSVAPTPIPVSGTVDGDTIT